MSKKTKVDSCEGTSVSGAWSPGLRVGGLCNRSWWQPGLISSAVELGPSSVGSCLLAGQELMGTLARLGSQEGSALGKVLLRASWVLRWVFQRPHRCGHGAVASLVLYAGENPTLLGVSHPQGLH